MEKLDSNSMSSSEHNLDALVHARLREVFGKPNNTGGHGEQWSLEPAPSSTTINVMCNGSSKGATVWIFDPYDGNNGVVHQTVSHVRQIDALIAEISERLNRAKQPRTNGSDQL